MTPTMFRADARPDQVTAVVMTYKPGNGRLLSAMALVSLFVPGQDWSSRAVA